ncbi:hypothetical protein [Nitratifractor sp.]
MELWQPVALSLLAETVETAWQYAPTMRDVMEKAWRLYRRSIFLLLLGHTGYLYLLYLSLRYGLLDWPIIVAIALKTLDIFTKIEIIRRVYVRGEIDSVTDEMLSMRIPLWLWMIGPLTYPWLVWMAFTHASTAF